MNLDVRYSSNGNTVYINAVALANLPVPKKYREAVVLAIREAFERGAAHYTRSANQGKLAAGVVKKLERKSTK